METTPLMGAAGGIAALNNAFGLAKTLLVMNLKAQINTVVIEMQKSMIEAQAVIADLQNKEAALRDENLKLTSRIGQLEKATADIEKYRLVNTGAGSFVYAAKQGVGLAEETHWLCAHCLDCGEKSILQNQGATRQAHNNVRFHCHVCGSDVLIDIDSPFYEQIS